ncbi:HAD-IIIA family hydrolase [Tissierella sp. MSJ-40]|uniref:D,D-heptose 1,7-bisphosphate phosphatase n=1 Tax=Tissierella simiarum TaxID=2841534 RepID=A0ABS6E799_9FIRM|nr:HAD-IIIA family hydrolase [Tissierella simiarum]MBU5438731.1 HAD-IIIA family hydrolase [Tissierella simiarum]
MSKIQAVFIDRDGTIGGSNEVSYPGVFQLFSFSDKSIKALKELGVKLYGFTNQPGISRGDVMEEDFINEMINFGFDGAYICPHQHTEGCKCRKPSPEMLYRAAEENDLDLTKCIVIGDRWSDILAGYNAGCLNILVLTGAGKEALNQYRYKWESIEANYIARDLEDAVRWIKELK